MVSGCRKIRESTSPGNYSCLHGRYISLYQCPHSVDMRDATLLIVTFHFRIARNLLQFFGRVKALTEVHFCTKGSSTPYKKITSVNTFEFNSIKLQKCIPRFHLLLSVALLVFTTFKYCWRKWALLNDIALHWLMMNSSRGKWIQWFYYTLILFQRFIQKYTQPQLTA